MLKYKFFFFENQANEDARQKTTLTIQQSHLPFATKCKIIAYTRVVSMSLKTTWLQVPGELKRSASGSPFISCTRQLFSNRAEG